MKALKTIRKMPPLARSIARLQRAIHSLEQRCDRLVKFADEIEQEGRTLRRESAELRGKLTVVNLNPSPPLWPEPPEGEAVEQVIGSDPRD
jgi:hypothetical protein